MNLNLYGWGEAGSESWVMIDLGVTFGGPQEPGIDLIMPDISYIEERRDRLLALVLTHAHEDHIGAVAHLWERLQCPIYATPFTAMLVEAKLREQGLPVTMINRIKTGDSVRIGHFDIQYMAITHSIPESHLLGIKTPAGRIVHTGDWKFDPDPVIGKVSDHKGFARFAEEGEVLAMVCDSTNAMTPGHSGSEREVANNLIDVVKKVKGRAVVTTFASNAARVKAIFEAAAANERQVVLVGRSMHRIVEAARSSGYLAGLPSAVPEEQAGFLPAEHTLILCTGSQGEGRAALGKMAEGNHPHIRLNSSDTVIFSSKVIPGNEKSVFRILNLLSEQGVQMVTEKQAPIHVSGHPCREELVQMYQVIRPKLAIPVHGEPMHMMEHARIAYGVGIAQAIVPHNGMMIELAPNLGTIVDDVPSGRIYIDGRVSELAGNSAADDRRRLNFAGVAYVNLLHKGREIQKLTISSRGVPTQLLIDHGAQFDEAISTIFNADGVLPSEEVLGEKVRQSVRRMYKLLWGKKPLVEVEVTNIEEFAS